VSGPKGKDVEPTVKGRKRSTADNWPPRAEPGAGQGAFERTEGLCQTMPNIGAMPHVPERARTRRVVRLVSVTADTDLSIELKPGMNRVGRQRQENHIVLVGPQISRFHAEIHVHDDGIVIRDLDSANGTFVNEEPVAEQELRAGDRIRFSDQFQFQLLIDIALQTPDSLTLGPSREEPLPETAPPPSAEMEDEPVPTSLRRRSQQLKLTESQRNVIASSRAPEEPVAAAPAPAPPAEVAPAPRWAPEPIPVPQRRQQPAQDRVPSLPSEEDAALMESISQAGDVGFGAGQLEMELLERERQQLGVLFQVSKRCMSAESLAELDRLLINVLERIVSFERGFLSYQLPTGDWKLVMSPKGDRWERKTVRSLLQTALKSRKPTLVLNSRTQDTLGSPPPGRTDARLLLPLVARASPVGAIFLIATQPRAFDEHTVDFLVLFADIAALAVVNCARIEGGR